MLTRTKQALCTTICTAVILVAASAGPALANARGHHGSVARWQAPIGAYASDAYASATVSGPAGRAPEPAYMAIQTRGYRENN